MKLTKKGLPDKRYREGRNFEGMEYAFWRKWGLIVIAALLGAFAGMIITKTLYDYTHQPLLSPRGSGVIKEVSAKETPCDYDPLTYIRCKGRQEGYDDYTISKFIRIARAESTFNLDQYAKNPNSTAKGIYQFIDSTWRQYCLKDGNVYNFVDNIDCFYKVLKVDGYPKGLDHWNASKPKWSLL
jgi:hypothetical protein